MKSASSDFIYLAVLKLVTCVLLFLPTISVFFGISTTGIIGQLDELLYAFLTAVFILFCFFKPPQTKFLLVVALIVTYQLAMVLMSGKLINGTIQIFLNSKLFIAFLAFAVLSLEDKYRFIIFFVRLLIVVVLSSAAVSVFQVLMPDIYYSFYQTIRHERGLLGVTLSAFFYSRAAFAQFLVFAIIFSLFISRYKSFVMGISDRRVCEFVTSKSWFILLFVLLFFTSSRKEIVFAFAFLPVYFLVSKGVSKLKLIVAAFGVVGFAIVFLALFAESTVNELGEGYARFQILLFSVEIFSDFFPLGTGPGTFGSLMSMGNPWVYEAYGVPDYIVYGYGHGGTERGPIFDLFLITLAVEMGVGIILYIWFFKMILSSDTCSKSACFKAKSYVTATISFLVFSSIFTPAFNTQLGFFSMMLCAVIIKTRTISSYSLTPSHNSKFLS